VNARSLQEDLLSIPGVEGAEVEGSADRPAGLRIRIAEGADQRAVGGAIRRVLTSHGLGTDTRLPGESAGEPTPSSVATVAALGDRVDEADEAAAEASQGVVTLAEPDEAAVIDLTGEEHDRGGALDEGVDEEVDDDVEDEGVEEGQAPEPGDDTEEPAGTVDAAPAADTAGSSGGAEPSPPVPDAVAEAPTTPGPAVVIDGVARLASVSVEEGRGGIVVTVAASDGASIRQAAASTEGGVEAAVVRATAKLAMPQSPEATVIEIEDRRVEGVDIVMIVLDVDGRKAAGSAVVGAGRAFALARATWSALSM
jgi:hypothetical protein